MVYHLLDMDTQRLQPGLRPHYHPKYHGAFFIGPDGHNVEAVCHKPDA